MEDDIDIYEDLPSFETKDGEKYKEEIRELSLRCDNFQQENTELKLKVAELSKKNQTLSDNLSSLLKTAKAEIGRKDRMISELRQQHDNMAFRRGGYGKTKPRKSKENHPRYNNYAPSLSHDTLPVASQPISRREGDDEVEEPEQKYEPEKIACTVFGERLRRKIHLEQEAERIQKEEAKLVMLESKAAFENVKIEPIKEDVTTSDIVKNEPQELPITLPEETALKSSAHSPSDVNTPYEEDDRNLLERRELHKKFLGCRIDKDAARPESKRRRLEDERYHSDDTRHYNGNVRHESRSNFERKDNLPDSGDIAKRLGHRRGSSNREEFARSRCGGRSNSTYRSRSRTPDRRHVEKRADRHRTDRYRAYMDKYGKRRNSGTDRDKDYSGKFVKDTHGLREKVEHRAEAKVGGRSEYGDYKNIRLDRDEKRGGRVSPVFNKSRSRSRGRTNSNAVDKRQAKSSDRFADAVVSDESSRERKGVKMRSKDPKRKVADRKDCEAETKLEKSSRTRSENEKANSKQASFAIPPGDSGNEATNKQPASSTQLPDGLLTVPETDLVTEEVKKQCKGTRRKSKDLGPTVAEDKDANQDSEMKSQTSTSVSSEKEVTNKQLVFPAQLSEVSAKDVTHKQLVSSAQLPNCLASKPKLNEMSEEMKKQQKVARRKSKDSEPTIAEGKDCDTESKSQTATETNSEEKATNRQPASTADATPEELKMQCKNAKLKNLESTVLDEKNLVSEIKIQTQPKINCENEATDEKLASCVAGAEDLSSKVESNEVPVGQNSQEEESAESTTATLPNEPSKVESPDKLISSGLENDTKGPSLPSETPEPIDAGSRSFREEKIENIEKFIQNYQDDDNICCRNPEAETEELNCPIKSCNSTSSILDALSMDLEVDAVGKPDDDTMNNSIISEKLLLESLSTPVKKNNPPLSPLPPPDEMLQPPLPPVPPPDDVKQPPLPPVPYPEEIKQQTPPPLPSSVEKERPPLPHSLSDEKQETPPLPSSDEKTKNLPASPKKRQQLPLPSPEGKRQLRLPSPERKEQLPLPSPERKQQPSLPSPDRDNQILLPLPSLDTKKQPLPTLSSPNKKKSSSPLIQSDDKNQHSPSISSSDEKNQLLPSALSADDKNQLSPSVLSAGDNNQLSLLLLSADDKNQLSLLLLSADDKNQLPPSVLSSDDKNQISPPLLSSDDKNQISPSLLSSDDKKQISESPLVTYEKTLPQKHLPLSSSTPEDKTQTLLSEMQASRETDDLPSSVLPATNEKNDQPSSEAPASKEKNDEPQSKVPAPKEKNDKPSSEAPASKDKNAEPSSEAPAPKEKNDQPSFEAPAPTDENEISETKEISASKSQPEKPRKDKVTLKQISRRHKIPCVPIVSRYSRKRHDMVLTDSEASRCIIKSDSSSDTETNNNAKVETKFSHVFTREPKVILNQVELTKSDDATLEKIHDDPDATIGKPEELIDVAKISTTENAGKIGSEIPSEVPESREPEKIVTSKKILPEILDEDTTSLPVEPEKNTEASQSQLEPEEQAASPKMRKRSALKTITAPDPSGDGLGTSASRKRTLPKEKENQSKQVEKKCRIMVVARRRRPVHLEDSSTAITLVPSTQDAKCDDAPKTSVKNTSLNGEKREIPQSIVGSVSKGRKRRSADK